MIEEKILMKIDASSSSFRTS